MNHLPLSLWPGRVGRIGMWGPVYIFMATRVIRIRLVRRAILFYP
jgi:hypothetical protein